MARRPTVPEPAAPLLVVGGALMDGARCLVAQRGPTMSSPFEWEFPGGKVEPGESPEEALVRELDEELGIRVVVAGRLGANTLMTPRGRLTLAVYSATIVAGQPRALEHAELRWVAADALADLDWAAADRPLVATVAAALQQDASLPSQRS